MAFRRLKALIAHGHATLNDAQTAIAVAEALVGDIQDGFGVTCYLDEGAAKSLLSLLSGKAGKLPIRVEVDPSVDSFPTASCYFDGGTHDGKTYRLNDRQRLQRSIVLEPGEVYVWDGRQFCYEGVSVEHTLTEESKE